MSYVLNNYNYFICIFISYQASLVIFIVMFKYIVFSLISLVDTEFCSLSQKLNDDQRFITFLEFFECHVICLVWRYEKYAAWPQVMLTTVSICVNDRHGKISAGMFLHFSSVSTCWACTIHSVSDTGKSKRVQGTFPFSQYA